ncbi:uncharacterized protein LOC126272575 [Schistocerca gregaria]|uniref:uncharacterized protein LOC126272575 n=1 Tax=Schistocerca gregaria TaxID=7010 RepID=UPI00211DA956|nr:uncharacterized protein LOC126272575 [Schistocerca gregaria]
MHGEATYTDVKDTNSDSTAHLTDQEKATGKKCEPEGTNDCVDSAVTVCSDYTRLIGERGDLTSNFLENRKSETSVSKTTKKKPSGKKKQRRSYPDESRMYYNTYQEVSGKSASTSSKLCADQSRDRTENASSRSNDTSEMNYQKGIAILSDLYGRLVQTEKQRKDILKKIESMPIE